MHDAQEAVAGVERLEVVYSSFQKTALQEREYIPRRSFGFYEADDEARKKWRRYEKRIASAEVIEFFEQLLRHHPRRHLVVVMDRAAPHISRAPQSFIDSQKRLHHFYQESLR